MNGIHHWALLNGPKSDDIEDNGKRYHAKQRNDIWKYDEQEIAMGATAMIPVRVLVSKVRLKNIVRSIPMRPDQPGWTCKSWVKEAYEALVRGNAIDGEEGWNQVLQLAE